MDAGILASRANGFWRCIGICAYVVSHPSAIGAESGRSKGASMQRRKHQNLVCNVYPAITILDWLADFTSLAPHLDLTGRLCYFAHCSNVMDQYDPAESISQCSVA